MSPTLRQPSFVRASILVLLVLFLSQQLLSAAPTIPARPTAVPDALLTSAETYVTSLPKAAGLSVRLTLMVDAIWQTPIDQLNEDVVAQARTMALDLANESAIALGAVNALANTIQALTPTLPAAEPVMDRIQAGFPSELRLLIQDQLRLLIHSRQLIQLWGNDPRLNVGEGTGGSSNATRHRAHNALSRSC
jgi:hypothetical protein